MFWNSWQLVDQLPAPAGWPAHTQLDQLNNQFDQLKFQTDIAGFYSTEWNHVWPIQPACATA